MKFTLRQLLVFQAVARFENVSLAAEKLALSQSAASDALNKLEQSYNTQLFDRVGKRLQLNEHGRMILPRTEALLAQAEALDAEMSKSEQFGDLAVGATLSIGNYLAITMVARFMAMHPECHIHLEVANTSTISKQIAHFEVDVGLLEGEIIHPHLQVTPWRPDELVVFCAPEHPLARKGTLTDSDLCTADWILREPGSGTRQSFERAMHGCLHRLNVVMELQHTEAIKRAVEARLGISCLSRITLEDAFLRGSLVRLQVPHRNFSRQFYIALHKQKYISPALKAWLSLCHADIMND